MATENWEYKDFVDSFPPKGKAGWVGLGPGGYSVAGAKLEFWQDWQSTILPELQTWLDQGWEPISEVGPGSIQIRTYRTLRFSVGGWIIFIILVIMTFYLFLIYALLTIPEYAEPVEFRVSMRRRIS